MKQLVQIGNSTPIPAFVGKDRWNGWLVPCIPIPSLPIIAGEFGLDYRFEEHSVVITYGEYQDVLSLYTIDGELCALWNNSWCWESAKIENT